VRHKQFVSPNHATNLDLSAPIDVYSDWIDAAEAVGRGAATGAGDQEDEYEEEGVEA